MFYRVFFFLVFVLTFTGFSENPKTPGSYKGNKCDNGSKWTFDVYIPKAYAEKPEKHFPVLYISSPSANPGFRKLEKWFLTILKSMTAQQATRYISNHMFYTTI